jgi:transcriptional regulator GlxA family with amidase domain
MLTWMDLPIVSREKLRHGDSANDTKDIQVERALDAMRKEPTKRWTVAQLARIAGLSRSAFARRFTLELGVPPLKWLAEHRLHLARERLITTDLPLAAIATEVGYVCEFAFAKAFKRLFGRSPGVFRRSSAFRAAA